MCKNLRELQLSFVKAIQDDAAAAPLLRRIEDAPCLSSTQRLSIYRDSISAALTAALADSYPVCQKLVGEEFFAAMAQLFIRQTPSKSPDLGDYGAGFANFIATFAPARSLPYLADVARLEWAWEQIFKGGDSNGSFDFAALASVSDAAKEKIVFQLPENSILFYSPYPVHRIWQVNQDDYVGDDEVSLDEGAAYLLLWRPAMAVQIDFLQQDEWRILNAASKGLKFAELCDQVAQKGQTVNLVEMLPQLISRGWIGGFHIEVVLD